MKYDTGDLKNVAQEVLTIVDVQEMFNATNRKAYMVLGDDYYSLLHKAEELARFTLFAMEKLYDH